MTDAAASRTAVETEVLRLIVADIGQELAEYYGAAVFHGGNVKPEQPNNELRNALNHMARALDASDLDAAGDNLRKAATHVERAKRDALKLATIGLFDEIRGIISNATYLHGAVQPAFVVRQSELNEARRQVYLAETAGHDDVLVRMLALFADATTLLKDVQATYAGVPAARRRALLVHRVRLNLLGYGVAFALGVVGSLTAAYLWDHWPVAKHQSSGQTAAGNGSSG